MASLKNFLALIIIITSFNSYSQVIADYDLLDEVQYPRRVDGYITKNNDTIYIGDTISIGQPSAVSRFEFISQGGEYGGSQLSGSKAIVHRIYVEDFKVNGRPTIVYLSFKGWGLLEVFVSYEQALAVGEVINNQGSSYRREEAIAKLKEAKELLDLELISKEEYDSIKNVLTPLILNQ